MTSRRFNTCDSPMAPRSSGIFDPGATRAEVMVRKAITGSSNSFAFISLIAKSHEQISSNCTSISTNKATGNSVIAPSEVLIGRKGDADVVLSNQHVSRHHAKIVMMPEGYFLQDLGSTHGTFVNDQLIEQHILKDGDRIALGKDRVELQYLVTDDLSTRAPADRKSVV